MIEPSARNRSGAAWVAVLVLAAACVAYVPGAFTRGVWRVDEIRLVAVAQQMGDHGHLLVPHLNGEVYSEKPPLLYWLIIGAHTVAQDWTVAGHLVVAALAALAALVLAHLGRHLSGDPRVGLVAALAFLTMAGVASHARQVTFDIAVAAWVFCALAALLHAGESTGRRRLLFTLLAGGACAAACLTKGPAPLLHVVIAAVTVGVVRRKHARAPWLPLGVALAIGVGLTLLWVLLASQSAGWWFWDRMVLRQSTSRMGSGAYHTQPFSYYFETLPGEFLVYTFFIFGAIAALARTPDADVRPALAQRAVFAWGLLGTLLFSCFAAKRPGYVLPLAGSFALVSGGAVRWAAATTSRARTWLVTLPLVAMAGASLLVGCAALAAPFLAPATIVARAPAEHAPWIENLTLGLRVVLAVGGVFVLGLAVVALRRLIRGEIVRGAVYLGLALSALLGATGFSIQRAQEPSFAPRGFVDEVFAALPVGAEPVLLGDELQGRVNLYTGIEHFDVVTVEGLLARTEGELPEALIAPDWAWHRVRDAMGDQYEVVVERETYDRGYVLLRRRHP